MTITFNEVVEYVNNADIEDLANLLDHMKDTLMIFDENHRHVKCVTAVHANGECIQLNAELWK